MNFSQFCNIEAWIWTRKCVFHTRGRYFRWTKRVPTQTRKPCYVGRNSHGTFANFASVQRNLLWYWVFALLSEVSLSIPPFQIMKGVIVKTRSFSFFKTLYQLTYTCTSIYYLNLKRNASLFISQTGANLTSQILWRAFRKDFWTH